MHLQYLTGRKYNVRGETEYPGTYEISLTDDTEMNLRQEFDAWLNETDNSHKNSSIQVTGDGEADIQDFTDLNIAGLQNFYQCDIKIWQLNGFGVPIYGYVLTNAFPSSVGAVELEDAAQSELSQFSVTFTYSESFPVYYDGPETAPVYPGKKVSSTNSTDNTYLNGSMPDSKNILENIVNNNKLNLPSIAYPSSIDSALSKLGVSSSDKANARSQVNAQLNDIVNSQKSSFLSFF